MRRRLKISSILSSALLVMAAVLCVTAPHATAQSTQTASFSIAGGNYSVDGVFPVKIYEDSGATDVNLIALELQYDPSKLELVSVDPPSSGLMNFPASPELKPGSAFISRASSSFGVVSGKLLFAVVNFKALTTTGTTSLMLGPQSQIYAALNSENIWDGNSTGATISFTPTTPESKPSQTTTAKPNQSVANTAKSKTKPTTVAASATETDVKDATVEQPVTVSIIGTDTQGTNVAGIVIVALVAAVAVAFASALVLWQKHHLQHRRHKRRKHA